MLLLRALSRLAEARSTLLRDGVLNALARVADKGRAECRGSALTTLARFVKSDREGLTYWVSIDIQVLEWCLAVTLGR